MKVLEVKIMGFPQIRGTFWGATQQFFWATRERYEGPTFKGLGFGVQDLG